MADPLDIASILKENERRMQAWRSRIEDYDPIRGTPGVIPRTELMIDERGHVSLWLPDEMIAAEDSGYLRGCLSEGSVEAAVRRHAEDEGQVQATFSHIIERIARERIAYDFEYWCAECVSIEDKEAQTVSFNLNAAQREALRHIEGLRLAGLPIRILELKGRQYGSTTMKSLYLAWFQLIRRPKTNAYMISLDNDGAKAITARYRVLAQHYPASFSPGRVWLTPYEGMQNTRKITTSRYGGLGFVSIASAERPHAPSGRTIQLALISEAGKMTSTTAKGAEQLVNNITSMIPYRPDTILIVESTADRSGKWFKAIVNKTMRGESAYTFVFIPWLLDPALSIDVSGDPAEFVRSWNEYERDLWDNAGATLAQINWYRSKLREKEGDAWKMQQEYPTRADEAFQTGAKRVFPPAIIEPHKRSCRRPTMRGALYGEGDRGADALMGIHFEASALGSLRIWEEPSSALGGLIDPDKYRYLHRYALAMDIGGVWAGADYTTVGVLDRAPTLFGGMPVIAAVWHGHLDQDLAAWEAARLARWYENGLLAVEVNSLRRDRGDPDSGLEPDHSGTVLTTIRRFYGNLYTRRVYDDQTKEFTEKLGFHTNRHTKPLIINLLKRYLRDQEYIEREQEALMEMETYVQYEDGTMGAEQGEKDDRVMMRAILLQVHEEMPDVVAIEKQKKQKHVPPATMAGY